MPKRLRPPRTPSLVGATVALALLATACGSGGADDTNTAAAVTAAAPDPASSAAASEATSEAVGPEAPAPAENLFAPVDVVNIADGSTLNLADELAGGDRPVLLWFWAPH